MPAIKILLSIITAYDFVCAVDLVPAVVGRSLRAVRDAKLLAIDEEETGNFLVGKDCTDSRFSGSHDIHSGS